MVSHFRKVALVIGFYLGMVVSINLISIPFALDEMQEQCPEGSRNCAHMTLSLNVPESEFNSAMEEWESTRVFTSTFEEGHIVDRTPFMQFPDDVYYENNCGSIELHSQSRLGGSDLGVNQNRLDNLKDFLDEYEWSGEVCQ